MGARPPFRDRAPIAPAPYTIVPNIAGAFLVATLTGNWTAEIVDRYRADLLSAGARLAAAVVDRRAIGILIDTRDFGPQPQEVVSYYTDAFAERRFHDARIAVLFGSMLQKMQVRRMAVGEPAFFEDWSDAVCWLTASG